MQTSAPYIKCRACGDLFAYLPECIFCIGQHYRKHHSKCKIGHFSFQNRDENDNTLSINLSLSEKSDQEDFEKTTQELMENFYEVENRNGSGNYYKTPPAAAGFKNCSCKIKKTQEMQGNNKTPPATEAGFKNCSCKIKKTQEMQESKVFKDCKCGISDSTESEEDKNYRFIEIKPEACDCPEDEPNYRLIELNKRHRPESMYKNFIDCRCGSSEQLKLKNRTKSCSCKMTEKPSKHTKPIPYSSFCKECKCGNDDITSNQSKNKLEHEAKKECKCGNKDVTNNGPQNEIQYEAHTKIYKECRCGNEETSSGGTQNKTQRGNKKEIYKECKCGNEEISSGGTQSKIQPEDKKYNTDMKTNSISESLKENFMKQLAELKKSTTLQNSETSESLKETLLREIAQLKSSFRDCTCVLNAIMNNDAVSQEKSGSAKNEVEIKNPFQEFKYSDPDPSSKKETGSENKSKSASLPSSLVEKRNSAAPSVKKDTVSENKSASAKDVEAEIKSNPRGSLQSKRNSADPSRKSVTVSENKGESAKEESHVLGSLNENNNSPNGSLKKETGSENTEPEKDWQAEIKNIYITNASPVNAQEKEEKMKSTQEDVQGYFKTDASSTEKREDNAETPKCNKTFVIECKYGPNGPNVSVRPETEGELLAENCDVFKICKCGPTDPSPTSKWTPTMASISTPPQMPPPINWGNTMTYNPPVKDVPQAPFKECKCPSETQKETNPQNESSKCRCVDFLNQPLTINQDTQQTAMSNKAIDCGCDEKFNFYRNASKMGEVPFLKPPIQCPQMQDIFPKDCYPKECPAFKQAQDFGIQQATPRTYCNNQDCETYLKMQGLLPKTVAPKSIPQIPRIICPQDCVNYFGAPQTTQNLCNREDCENLKNKFRQNIKLTNPEKKENFVPAPNVFKSLPFKKPKKADCWCKKAFPKITGDRKFKQETARICGCQKTPYHKTTVEIWHPGTELVTCPFCNKTAAPLVKKHKSKIAGSSLGASILMNFWPICFLPIVGGLSIIRIYCSHCEQCLGIYDRHSGQILTPDLKCECKLTSASNAYTSPITEKSEKTSSSSLKPKSSQKSNSVTPEATREKSSSSKNTSKIAPGTSPDTNFIKTTDETPVSSERPTKDTTTTGDTTTSRTKTPSPSKELSASADTKDTTTTKTTSDSRSLI